VGSVTLVGYLRRVRPALGRRDRLLAALLVLLLALLTALVPRGAFTRLDQHAVDHWMPWLVPSSRAEGTTLAGYWRPFPLDISTGDKLMDLVSYPCSLLLSGLLVTGATLLLRRRGYGARALAPAAAWLVGNGLEWVGKHVLTRPPLYGSLGGERLPLRSFGDSYPSGHMIRGILAAYLLALLWPRARAAAALWAVAVAPSLVLVSAHTPSDVAGGALIGLLLVLLVNAALRPPPLSAGRGSGSSDRSSSSRAARTAIAPGSRT